MSAFSPQALLLSGDRPRFVGFSRFPSPLQGGPFRGKHARPFFAGILPDRRPQALGFPPERKYQQEGGPLLRDCIGLLREWSTVAERVAGIIHERAPLLLQRLE